MIAIEVCVDSLESALIAEESGADRIELCSSIAEGGLTPSIGLISETCKHLQSTKIHTLLRPRPGDFLYSDNELAIIKADLLQAVTAGTHGIVFGCLTPHGHIAIDQLTYIVDLCKTLSVELTFHRAFDVVKDQFKSLQDLIGCGVKRVLTSGGHPTAAPQGIDQLGKLVSEGGDMIVVMAGGGITDENAVSVVESTGVKEIHGTFRRRIETGMKYVHPRVSFSSSYLGLVDDYNNNNNNNSSSNNNGVKRDDWKRYVTDGDMIESIKRQLEENME